MKSLIIKCVSAAILSILVLIAAIGSWFIVAPGNEGVITRAGALVERSYPEGFHFKIPILDSNNYVNIQTLTHVNKNVDAGTKDLQSVSAQVAVIFSVDRADVIEVYRNYRNVENLQSRVLTPAIEEAYKSVVAKRTAEELITQRQLVRDDLIKDVRNKLKPHFVSVKDVNIVNFAFSAGFTKAVEAKVEAEQNALKASHDLARIRTEGEQRVATAKAEAEAIRAQAEAINKQGGAEYVQLKWIEKWNGTLPTHQLGSANTMIGVK